MTDARTEPMPPKIVLRKATEADKGMRYYAVSKRMEISDVSIPYNPSHVMFCKAYVIAEPLDLDALHGLGVLDDLVELRDELNTEVFELDEVGYLPVSHNCGIVSANKAVVKRIDAILAKLRRDDL